MPKIRLLFILGILIAFFPFSGFPQLWKSAFFSIAGILVSILTFLLYKEIKRRLKLKEERRDEMPSFVENRINDLDR